MSAFTVNEVCHRLVHDPPFREAMRADPATALVGADVTDEERTLLLSGAVGELYRRRSHAFLLGHLARYGIAGMTVPIYNERMRAVADLPLYDEPEG